MNPFRSDATALTRIVSDSTGGFVGCDDGSLIQRLSTLRICSATALGADPIAGDSDELSGSIGRARPIVASASLSFFLIVDSI